MIRCIQPVLSFILVILVSVHGQRAYDTTLFTIPLAHDTLSQSLIASKGPGQIRKTLSGPVLMQDKSLLFYSENGYLLYDQKGTLLDSHSVFHKNRGKEYGDSTWISMAFPVDESTLLFYQKVRKEEFPLTLYEKKLFKARLREIKDKNIIQLYLKADQEHLLNFAHNSVTDDMAQTFLAKPQLVGYSALNNSGIKWWSIDKYYSIISPLINENNGRYISFFPGIQDFFVKRNQLIINPVQIFPSGNSWYYAGVHANVGHGEDSYSQVVYVIDAAGNILFTDNLLKQVNHDAIIGEDADTYYTVKKVNKFVFQPVFDIRGAMFYGSIDYIKKAITVKKRGYYRYTAKPTGPDLAHLIDIEKNITYEPVNISPGGKAPVGKTVPKVSFVDEKGRTVIAQARHLTKDEYIVRLSRSTYRDIEKKLVSNSRSQLPPKITAIKDSLSKISTISCPYTLSLSGPKGMVRDFNYSPDVEVLCARVLAVRDSGEVIVRVDGDLFAEILIFSFDGTRVDRFVFNAQPYKKRKDIVVATNRSAILELDYETKSGKETFFKWQKEVL